MWHQGVSILDTLLSTHRMGQQHGWSKVHSGTSRLVQLLKRLSQAALKLSPCHLWSQGPKYCFVPEVTFKLQLDLSMQLQHLVDALLFTVDEGSL